MDFMFIDAKYKETDLTLNKKTLEHCKRYKKIAVFAAVQFVHRLETILKQLEKEKKKCMGTTNY